MTVCRLF